MPAKTRVKRKTRQARSDARLLRSAGISSDKVRHVRRRNRRARAAKVATAVGVAKARRPRGGLRSTSVTTRKKTPKTVARRPPTRRTKRATVTPRRRKARA